nr:hypothetical protein GCM10020093_106310 [Planobispora longispora]
MGALVLSWETLGERPSPLQLLGCGIILAAVAYATVTGRGRRKHPEADTPSEGEEEPHAPDSVVDHGWRGDASFCDHG